MIMRKFGVKNRWKYCYSQKVFAKSVFCASYFISDVSETETSIPYQGRN